MYQGNPNKASNPYAPTRYGQAQPGQTNNPATYGRQVVAGQGQLQPNATGYGGGTNTTRAGGYQMPAPAPLNPTPVAPTPAPVVSPWNQQPANWNGGAYTINGMTFNPAGFSNYSGPQWADPYATYQSQGGGMGPEWWAQHMQGAGAHPNGSISFAPQQSQGFQMPQQLQQQMPQNGGGNPWSGGGSNPWSSIADRFGY